MGRGRGITNSSFTRPTKGVQGPVKLAEMTQNTKGMSLKILVRCISYNKLLYIFYVNDWLSIYCTDPISLKRSPRKIVNVGGKNIATPQGCESHSITIIKYLIVIGTNFKLIYYRMTY